MNSHLNGIFLVFHFQLGSSCVCYHLWLCHRARYHSLVRSQNELESSSSISIEMCLHWHQYSSTFLMPPVRIPPPLPCLHIPSSLHLLFPPPHIPTTSYLSLQTADAGKPRAAPVQLWLRHTHSSLHPCASWSNLHGKH